MFMATLGAYFWISSSKNCRMQMMVAESFLKLEANGDTLKSDAKWMRLVDFEEKETGGDSFEIFSRRKILDCEVKQDGIAQISVKYSVVASIGGYELVQSQAERTRVLEIIDKHGSFKVNAFSTVPPYVNLDSAIRHVQALHDEVCKHSASASENCSPWATSLASLQTEIKVESK